MKKTTLKTCILSVLLISLLMNSCSGLFSGRFHNDEEQPNPSQWIIHLRAGTSDRTGNGARSVWPTAADGEEYRPVIEEFTNFKLITDIPVSSDTSWKDYNSFSNATIILNPTRTYTVRLIAEYKGGEWCSKPKTISANSSDTTISFVLEPTGKGTFGISLDITAVCEQTKSVRFWFSNTPVNRSATPTKVFDPQNGAEDPLTWTDTTRTPGTYWALFEILDKNDASTIIGPEAVYVFPGQESVWSPVIEELNRKYKITFSKEGFDYDDRAQHVNARLSGNPSFPSDIVVGMYETVPEGIFDNYEIFIPPAGYCFSDWWDGNDNLYCYYDEISGGTYTDDVTFYPLWGRCSSIYNESTEEEINSFIQREIEDESVTGITVSFNSDFSSKTAWNTAMSALASQSKPVVLNLQNVDADWFESNICPDPENPDASKTFARIAGTEDTANTWLKQVRIPTTTQKIPAYAFYNCTALEQIIYDTAYAITEIGEYAFANDRNFTSFYNSSNGESYPRLSTSTDVVIGKRAFLKSGITSIPTGGTSTKIIIGDEAYKDCESLTSIDISLGLYSIGAHAFDSCKNLTTVIYTTNINGYAPKLNTIGDSAFVGTALHTDPDTDYKSLLIPYTVRTIGDGAFKGLKNLTSVTFETSTNRKLTKIGANAFKGTGITAIEIPNTVTTIGDSAFQECTSLASVTIDSTASKLTTIGELAFEKCAFTTFTLPANVTSMGEAAFAKNEALTEFKFASGYKLHKIPVRCFYYCKNFSTITIGSGITYIDYDAFVGTKSDNLTSGNLLASTWTMFTLDENHKPATYTRSGSLDTKIKANLTGTSSERYVRDFALTVNTPDEIYSYIEECSTLQNSIPLGICTGIDFAWDTIQTILDGIECTNEYGINLDLSCIQIAPTASDEQKTIPSNFLKDKTWLKEITLPHTFSTSPYIVAIGDNAFSGCTNLTSVTNLNGVTNFRENAFAGCTSLTTLSSLAAGSWYGYDAMNGTLAEYTASSLSSGLKGTAAPAFIKDAAPAEAISASNLVDLVKSKTNSSTAHFDLVFSGEIASVSALTPLQNLTVGVEGATIGLDLSQVTITGTGAAARELNNSFFAGYNDASYNSTTQEVSFEGKTVNKPVGTVLKSIKLPQNLNSLNPYAIAYCPQLESITIPESVTSTGSLAFAYNPKLAEVIFAETSKLKTLGSMSFSYTPSLAGIILPESLEGIGQMTFMDSGLESITIPDNTDFTSNGIFSNCKKLERVVIGAGVTNIKGCFDGCTSITSFEINGETNWYIRIEDTSDGRTYRISQAVSSSLADDICSDISIRKAYLYRDTLKNVLTSNASTLSTSTSYSKQGISLAVSFDSWDDLAPLATYNSTTPFTIDLSEATDNSSDKTIPKGFFEGKNNITSFSMPSGTTTIGERAFASNAYTGQQERTFTFNEDITTIEGKAFFCNSLTGSFVIPDTITTLGAWAFAGCEPMAPVITASSKLTAIPDYCFLNCKGKSTDKIIIPAGCTSIGKNAFWAITAGGRTEPITFADSSSSWIQYLEEGSSTTSETIITAANMPTSTSLYQTPNDYTATAYRWEKVIGNITSGLQFKLVDFTYAESHYIYTTTWEEETLTYPLTRNFETKSGQWTVDKANNTLTLSPSETITSDDIISILKTVMYTIGPVDEFNPYEEASNYNYIIKNSLPASFEPESLSLNELKQTTQPKVTESDTTVFKAVTYIINLGTLSNGTPVVLNEDYSQGSCIPYKYGWTVHGNKGESVIYCEGYEGTGFPADLSDLKADYGPLVKTNAAGSIGSASFEAPSSMIAGEGTIIWN